MLLGPGPSILRAVVSDSIGFVLKTENNLSDRDVIGLLNNSHHNLSLNQLLDDVFQSHQADSLVERIPIAVIVDAMNERHLKIFSHHDARHKSLEATHVSLVPLLKLFKHNVQSQIVEHEVAWILIKFAQHSQRRVVVSVNKC